MHRYEYMIEDRECVKSCSMRRLSFPACSHTLLYKSYQQQQVLVLSESLQLPVASIDLPLAISFGHDHADTDDAEATPSNC